MLSKEGWYVNLLIQWRVINHLYGAVRHDQHTQREQTHPFWHQELFNLVIKRIKFDSRNQASSLVQIILETDEDLTQFSACQIAQGMVLK